MQPTTTPTTPTPATVSRWRAWGEACRGSLFLRALISLVVVVGLGMIFNADHTFFEWDTHRDMLRQISVFGMLACGMTLVIITGGIDLSVGSVLGLVAVLFSLLTMQHGMAPWLAIVLCLLAGAGCGAVSGGLIARFNLQPFIATLAMMVFARGLAKFISGGQKISTAVPLADGTYKYVDVPKIFDMISAKVLQNNVAVVTLILLVCLVLCWVLLSRLRWGRYLYALGGNEEAARLSGIPVSAMKVLAYSLCGLFCALAGICQAAQELQGDPEAGSTYELTAIAIVVIGGTSLRGGRGGIWLTLLGILTIGYLEKILSINAVGEASRLMLTGAIIVGAVLLQRNRNS
ncbi:MAG TPA: ABC transporter permease [Armatimonadota bacterium]|jgi:ribose transport system permease protein